MRAKLLIVNCPLVLSARGPCSSVSTGWSMAAKDQKTPKRESQFQNIKHVTAESCKMRFSLLYLLPHSHQFLNIRPLNISCDDCITGMWRIYKLVDLPNLVEGFIKSNRTIAARCSRFVSRAEERRGWRRPSVLTLPLPSFALEGWMVSGIGSICVSWEEEGRGIVGFGRVIVRRLSLTQLGATWWLIITISHSIDSRAGFLSAEWGQSAWLKLTAFYHLQLLLPLQPFFPQMISSNMKLYILYMLLRQKTQKPSCSNDCVLKQVFMATLETAMGLFAPTELIFSIWYWCAELKIVNQQNIGR